MSTVEQHLKDNEGKNSSNGMKHLWEVKVPFADNEGIVFDKDYL